MDAADFFSLNNFVLIAFYFFFSSDLYTRDYELSKTSIEPPQSHTRSNPESTRVAVNHTDSPRKITRLEAPISETRESSDQKTKQNKIKMRLRVVITLLSIPEEMILVLAFTSGECHGALVILHVADTAWASFTVCIHEACWPCADVGAACDFMWNV